MSIALSQKTALVTGSSRGIGRGIALKLAEHGVKKIAINYNENEPAAQDALRKLRGHGADGFVIKADAFSASAKEKIEKSGGRAEVVAEVVQG